MLFKPEDDIFQSKLYTEEEKKKQNGNRHQLPVPIGKCGIKMQ